MKALRRQVSGVPAAAHRIGVAWILAFAALIAHATAQVESKPRETLEVQCGDMKLTYESYKGLKVVVHGIEMIRGNSFWVMKPGWSGRIYGLPDSPGIFENARVDSPSDGSKIITLDLRKLDDTPGPFRGELKLHLKPDNSIGWEVDYELEEGTDAILEFGVGQLNAAPLIGTPFSSSTWSGADVSGTVPVEAASPDPGECTLADGIRRMTIRSRMGPIVIEANEAASILLFDYRKNVWASEGKPIFWLGHLGRPIPTGQQVRYTVRIDFPDDLEPISEAIALSKCQAGTIGTPAALVPDRSIRPIIPAPKELVRTESHLALGSETKIYVGPDPSSETDKAVAFLMRDLREKYNLYPEIVRKDAPSPITKGAILIGEKDRLPQAAELIGSKGLELPSHAEGYALAVDDGAAVVSAGTGRGVFNGITTLVQLIAVDDRGVMLRGAEVTDWPSLDFRGIHAFSGKGAGAEIAKAVRELMARFKINRFVWETEYIIWDSHPDIAHPSFGMTKSDAAQVVQAAKDNLIEIIPLIQSLGHSDYIFVHGHNLDIAEDPEIPYAYSPENPDSYAFIFDLYDEAIEFFGHPEIFHIGHDEVTMTGRFPYRSRESGKSNYELVFDDIGRLHEWFKERGIRVMMWSDMFLAEGEAPDATFAETPEQAKKFREQLPGDVFIADWHYAPVAPEELTSLSILDEAGFDVVGCSWYNPINIRSQALAAIEAGTEGTLQTTWAGFNFKIDDNEASWHQYSVYLLAAHYAWSGDDTMPSDLSWQARQIFYETWYGGKPLRGKKPGFFVDLSSAANRSLSDHGKGSGWLGFGERLDMSALPMGEGQFGETVFRIAQNADGDAAVMLAGWLNPEGAFPIRTELNLTEPRAAAELHFLLAAAFATAEKAQVGSIEVIFTDGSRENIDLVYGSSIFAPSEVRQGRGARIAWTGETQNGESIRLWDLKWVLDNSGKPIQTIALVSDNTEAAPVVFAITGVR